MLDQKTFLQGLNYLKANYLNWQFDLNNDVALKVWYKKLSVLDNETFFQMIEQYTDSNKFPPNSPSDILDIIKPVNSSGEAAWEWIISLNKQYPLENDFQKPKFYQELKKDKIAYKLFERFQLEENLIIGERESEELDREAFYNQFRKLKEGKSNYCFVGFGFGYKKDKFIRYYNEEIKPKNMLSNPENMLRIEVKEKRLLGL